MGEIDYCRINDFLCDSKSQTGVNRPKSGIISGIEVSSWAPSLFGSGDMENQFRVCVASGFRFAFRRGLPDHEALSGNTLSRHRHLEIGKDLTQMPEK
jgi:hypothetical protein